MLALNAKGLPLGAAVRVRHTGAGAGRQVAALDRRLPGHRGAARELPRKIRVIAVMDREGDSFELLDAQRQKERVEILVRARHDRRLERKGERLFATLAGGRPD
ncbi:MAG: hypothetical protein OXC19_03040 [Bryobacterales bacterium]|nr:hypothetical protein [Bryobacterales bacterium]